MFSAWWSSFLRCIAIDKPFVSAWIDGRVVLQFLLRKRGLLVILRKLTLNFSKRWFLFSAVKCQVSSATANYITSKRCEAADTVPTSRLNSANGNYRSLTVKLDGYCRNSNTDEQFFIAAHAHAWQTVMFYSFFFRSFRTPPTVRGHRTKLNRTSAHV